MTSEDSGAVFDCNVFVQALLNSRGPAFACKELADNGTITLFLSAEIIEEVKEVLSRPKLQQRFSALTPERVDAFLQDLVNQAVLLTDVPALFSYERDPKDERYVNLALAADAQHLVTRDKDLLDLMKDEAFRQRFPDLIVLDPVVFLGKITPVQQPVKTSERSGESSQEGRT